MFETVRNAFKLKEIRSRIIYTLLMLVVVRIGTQLPIPGSKWKLFFGMVFRQFRQRFRIF